MEIETTALGGVLLLRPVRHDDERGFFSETCHRRRLAQAGVTDDFVQENHSLSRQRHTVRGLHFQAPPFAQGKLVRVVRGRVLDVVVDIRRGSPTFARHVAVELSAENWRQIYVPPGFAHGFCTLARDCEVVYKVSAYYAPAHDRGLLWHDPALGIDWPMAPHDATVSQKDRRQPALAALSSPFVFVG